MPLSFEDIKNRIAASTMIFTRGENLYILCATRMHRFAK